MKKLLVAVAIMILMNLGLGAIGFASEDPRPWVIKPPIEVTESGEQQ